MPGAPNEEGTGREAGFAGTDDASISGDSDPDDSFVFLDNPPEDHATPSADEPGNDGGHSGFSFEDDDWAPNQTRANTNASINANHDDDELAVLPDPDHEGAAADAGGRASVPSAKQANRDNAHGSGSSKSALFSPYFGANLSASQITTTLTGVVRTTAALAGMTVSAYEIQANGMRELIGTSSAATDANGAFSIRLDRAPARPVYLVARRASNRVADGGSFVSVDETVQPVDQLDLLTPIVLADYNFFVITPVTHIVAQHVWHQMKLKLAEGTQLDDFSEDPSDNFRIFFDREFSIHAHLRQHAPDQILPLETRDLLKTVPGSDDDKLQTYADTLTDIEWGAVSADVPSGFLYDTLAANAQSRFQRTRAGGLLNSAGHELPAGAWVDKKFRPTVPRSWSTHEKDTGYGLLHSIGMYSLLNREALVSAGLKPMDELTDRYLAITMREYHASRASDPTYFSNTLKQMFIDKKLRNNRTLYMKAR